MMDMVRKVRCTYPVISSFVVNMFVIFAGTVTGCSWLLCSTCSVLFYDERIDPVSVFADKCSVCQQHA